MQCKVKEVVPVLSEVQHRETTEEKVGGQQFTLAA
jgi:hypothetical protein